VAAAVFLVTVFFAGTVELDISLMTLPMIISGRFKRTRGYDSIREQVFISLFIIKIEL
jgi:hypothetical protein